MIGGAVLDLSSNISKEFQDCVASEKKVSEGCQSVPSS